MRIGRSKISVLYPQIRTILPEGFAIKLKAIIRDEGMGNPESSYDILPDESSDIYISDISQRFSLDPLGKIICADQQVLFVSKCFRERTYNVLALLSKRLRVGKRIENSSRLVNV